MCKARCSEASVSAVGCLEEEHEEAAGTAVGGRETRGAIAEGMPSPFLL